MKMSKLETKNEFFGTFRLELKKKYCDIWNPYARICVIPKFFEITKMRKFKNKNAFLGYFGARFMKKDWKFEIDTFEFV